jgi:hypothetical protein
MWAVIDENSIVLGWIGGKTYEEAIVQADGNRLIEMTLENSPATIGWYWNGKIFQPVD